jgi:hypothetical protein
MTSFRFGPASYGPRSVRVPFQSDESSGEVLFTRAGEGLSEPAFDASDPRGELARAAQEFANEHRAELLAMLADTEKDGFYADAGVVVYRVEDALEFGIVSFWSPEDCDPGWIGNLSSTTLASIVTRFRRLPAELRQRLFDVARAQINKTSAAS